MVFNIKFKVLFVEEHVDEVVEEVGDVGEEREEVDPDDAVVVAAAAGGGGGGWTFKGQVFLLDDVPPLLLPVPFNGRGIFISFATI